MSLATDAERITITNVNSGGIESQRSSAKVGQSAKFRTSTLFIIIAQTVRFQKSPASKGMHGMKMISVGMICILIGWFLPLWTGDHIDARTIDGRIAECLE